MSDDLVAFLRARLDEDAQIARKAAVRQTGGETWSYDQPAVRAQSGMDVVSRIVPVRGEHIARHDPARVLAEIEAKRRMIESFERCSYSEGTAPHEDMRNVAGAKVDTWRFVLRLLALPYADHPAFREEWRP